MRNHHTQGIVLKSRSFNDTDKFVTLITPHFGRIDAVAKGASKIISKFVSSLDTLNLCEFELYKSKTWLIRDTQILNNFSNIKTNFKKSNAAQIIANLIYKTSYEGNIIDDFELFKKTLLNLQKNDVSNIKNDILEFKTDLLRIHGLLPSKINQKILDEILVNTLNEATQQ